MNVSVADESDLARLPSTLKKCARTFLDLVAEIILSKDTENVDDEDQRTLAAKDSKLFDEHQRQINADVFMEDSTMEDFLETLPQLEQLENLDGKHKPIK